MTLPYREIGDGPTVVLIHGHLANGSSAWSEQWKFPPDGIRLIAPDRRGHGKASIAPRPYTIAGDAEDLLDVFNVADIARAHVVGHSSGAAVALALHELAPERVLSLHLLEPPFLGMAIDDADCASMMDATSPLFGDHTIAAVELAARFIEAVAGREAMERLQARSAWSTIVAEAEALRWSEIPARWRPFHWPEPDRPVTIYLGGRGSRAFAVVARAIARIRPTTEIVTIATAGHDVQRVNVEFVAALRARIGT